MEHPRSKLSYQISANPKGKAGNGHGHAANASGIHLGQQDKDDCRNGYGTTEYIKQEEEQQETVGQAQRSREAEIETYQQQRKHHARYTIVNKLLAAYLINDEDGRQSPSSRH